MKITNADIEIVAGALRALDGVYDGPKLVTPYAYKSGKTIFAIATNLNVIESPERRYKSALDKLIIGLHPDEKGRLEGMEAVEYLRKKQELDDCELDLPLVEILISEDEVRDNKIPALVIARLRGLIKAA